MSAHGLFQQTVDIASDYLGPTAERFMSRQIQNHLSKSPESITQDDLVKLADWIKISLALITEDTKIVMEFTDRLVALTYSDASMR